MPDSSSFREIARRCRSLFKERPEEASELAQQLQQWAVECDAGADRALSAEHATTRLDRAHRYRLRAEEYRSVRDQVQSPAARASYESLAQTYDAMARQLESDAAAPGVWNPSEVGSP